MNAMIVERVVERAVEIQQIAAPPFDEGRRAEFVRQQFLAEGLLDVSLDSLNNVFGRLPGQGQARPLLVSAHLDTVFPLTTDLSVRREADRIYAPGIGDNSLGVAGLFGLIWALRQPGSQEPCELPGDLWLVANVGEEGLGDLRGMSAVVQRFGSQPLAYLILEGMALGQVYHRALGVQRYRVTIRTRGGHSWVDYGRPSAVHELAELVNRLTAIALPADPRTTLNVGVISGGSGVNVIASEACFELDLRSEDAHTLEELARRVELLCQSDIRPGVRISVELIGQRPSGHIPKSHPLVSLGKRCLHEQGLRPTLTIGSTDANIPLSQGLPAITLGLSSGGGAHTTGEYINLAPLAAGLAQVTEFVRQVFSVVD